MAGITLTLSLQKRWWFWIAIVIGLALVRLGIVRDKANAEYVDGVEPALERIINWIADRALIAVVE